MSEALHTPKLLALDVCVNFLEDNLDHRENIALVIHVVKGKPQVTAFVVVDYDPDSNADIARADGQTAEEAIRLLANSM